VLHIDPIQFQIRIQHFRRKETTKKCRKVYTGIKDDESPKSCSYYCDNWYTTSTGYLNNTVPVTVGPLPGGLSGVVIHIVDPTPAGRGFVSPLPNYLFLSLNQNSSIADSDFDD
jgi:hypothetical protein